MGCRASCVGLTSRGFPPGSYADDQRVRRLEEGIELLEEMAAATPPIQTADRYVKLLRAKCTRKGIESALIPADPNIFLRDVKKDLRSRGKRTARARQLNNF